MMRISPAWVFVFMASPALAETSTIDARIGSQIGQLVIQNASQAVQIEQLLAALSAAQTRVKALEYKYEPKAIPSGPKTTPDVP